MVVGPVHFDFAKVLPSVVFEVSQGFAERIPVTGETGA